MLGPCETAPLLSLSRQVKAVLFAALYPNVAVMDDEAVPGGSMVQGGSWPSSMFPPVSAQACAAAHPQGRGMQRAQGWGAPLD